MQFLEFLVQHGLRQLVIAFNAGEAVLQLEQRGHLSVQGLGELCGVAAVLRQVCANFCEEVQVRPVRAVRRTFAGQLFVMLCYVMM